MATKAVSVLCLLLCAQAFAVRNLETTASRSLKQASANVTGSVILIGPGTIIVSARAVAEAVETVRNAFAIAFATAIAQSEAGGDAFALAIAEAEALALAVAQALASTFIQAESDAPGASVCVSATSQARATARAVAVVIVEVLAQASNSIDFANSDAAITAIVDATVSAYALSASDVCGNGPFDAVAYTDILVRETAQPFASVFALALAIVKPGVAIADLVIIAEAGVLRSSTIDGRSASAVVGEAEAASGGEGMGTNN